MSDYRSCDWCGRNYNFLAIGGPQRNPYCSPKCYKESGAEEEFQKRMEGERIAREAEEARWNSLSKEEQEAEIEAPRKEAERKEKERWNSLSKEEQDAEIEAKRELEEALENLRKEQTFWDNFDPLFYKTCGIAILVMGVMIILKECK